MKKILLFVYFATSLIVNIQSQELFATYDCPIFDKTYDIKIEYKENGNYSIYVYALSLDYLIKEGGFIIKNTQLDGFLLNLNEARNKYVEWVETAKINKVEDLKKKIEIKSQKIGGYFYFGNSWHHDNDVRPKYMFIIDNNEGDTEVKYELMVITGELESTSNQFTKCDNFVLAFLTTEEIDSFISLLSKEKIEEFRSAPKIEKLFK